MFRLVEGDFDAFFRTPFDCYEPQSLYVSPYRSDLRAQLDTRINPLFGGRPDLALFTVQAHGRSVGRITAHLHRRANEMHGTSCCYFGFFDCIDDPDVAGLLLEAAEAFGRQCGCEEIAGNFNLTATQPCGVMTEGFEHAPYTDQLYNPPYTARLLRAHGYEATFPMSTFELDLVALDSRAATHHQLRRDAGLSWRMLRTTEFAKQLNDMRTVLNDGFARIPMFVPLSREEFQFQASPLEWLIDERLTPIGYIGNEPVSTIFCIPDANPLLRAMRSRLRWNAPYVYVRHWVKRRRAVILFYSVVRALHNHGLNSASLNLLTQALRRAGYAQLGVTWISDENAASLRQMQKLGARRMHRLHLFRKRLR